MYEDRWLVGFGQSMFRVHRASRQMGETGWGALISGHGLLLFYRDTQSMTSIDKCDIFMKSSLRSDRIQVIGCSEYWCQVLETSAAWSSVQVGREVSD